MRIGQRVDDWLVWRVDGGIGGWGKAVNVEGVFPRPSRLLRRGETRVLATRNATATGELKKDNIRRIYECTRLYQFAAPLLADLYLRTPLRGRCKRD